MHVVIDTNVFISASLSSSSTTRKAVNWCLDNCEMCFSESTLHELSSRITRSKFDQYSLMNARQAFAKKIHNNENSILCVPQEKITDSPDPTDNKFLEVAVECEADYLITGDKKHLLPLHPYRTIQILQPHDFLKVTLSEK
jgi:putative PIN family toxin of toxin-antitoxin system